jgi:hypothetical protein
MKQLSAICLLLMVFFSVQVFGQWDFKKVLIPETAASDSFNTPGDNVYLSGLQFPDTTGTGIGTSLDSIWFLVSSNPAEFGWDTLSYNDVVYAIKITGKAITLKLPATFAWEWWKIYFEDAVSDSVYFYPQFNDMD